MFIIQKIIKPNMKNTFEFFWNKAKQDGWYLEEWKSGILVATAPSNHKSVINSWSAVFETYELDGRMIMVPHYMFDEYDK